MKVSKTGMSILRAIEIYLENILPSQIAQQMLAAREQIKLPEKCMKLLRRDREGRIRQLPINFLYNIVTATQLERLTGHVFRNRLNRLFKYFDKELKSKKPEMLDKVIKSYDNQSMSMYKQINSRHILRSNIPDICDINKILFRENCSSIYMQLKFKELDYQVYFLITQIYSIINNQFMEICCEKANPLLK